MANLMNAAAERRLSEYFDRIGALLGRKGRRESFALYAEGVLGDGERKSIEPIAARACADPARADAEHQRLLHFALDAPWSDDNVRREAARYALDAMTAREPVDSWIIDDTGFLKQGKHSVGVQRQYTGSAGKTTNCQVGVSLTVSTRTEQVPIDFSLYLPEVWTESLLPGAPVDGRSGGLSDGHRDGAGDRARVDGPPATKPMAAADQNGMSWYFDLSGCPSGSCTATVRQ